MLNVSHNDAMAIALEAEVSLASVKKRLRGEPIRGRAGERLEQVLNARGLLKERAESSSKESAPGRAGMRLHGGVDKGEPR